MADRKDADMGTNEAVGTYRHRSNGSVQDAAVFVDEGRSSDMEICAVVDGYRRLDHWRVDWVAGCACYGVGRICYAGIRLSKGTISRGKGS